MEKSRCFAEFMVASIALTEKKKSFLRLPKRLLEVVVRKGERCKSSQNNAAKSKL